MALGWAMVGTGAHVYGRMAPAGQRAAGTGLVAVCSRDLTRAQDYARTFGFERACDSYAAVLAADDVDVVYLATPNHLHAEQAIAAARAGKHVMVEKPMALSVADAEAMVEACRAHGVKLGVGFHLRHHPGQQEVRRILAEGLLGEPHLIELHWGQFGPPRTGWWTDPTQVGAYVLMGRGVHLMDQVYFLTGREPQQIMAMTNGQRPDRPLEELATALLRLGDDTHATLVASRLFAHTDNELTIYGSAGWLRTVGTLNTNPTGTLELVTGTETRRIAYREREPYQAMIEAFNRAILENLEPSASGEDGLRVVRITEAILESARTGRAVSLAASSAV